MKFSQDWLQNIVAKSYSTAKLSHMLTMAGLEVEALHPVADEFNGVVLAYIEEAIQHPNAEKLRVCKVRVNANEVRQIVCGAKNARAGIYVACALGDLAVLNQNHSTKPPFKIGIAKLRGEMSEGMLCSANELGIEPSLYSGEDGILELIFDEAKHKLGQDIREVLNLNDTVFEIKLTPNRSDCLSLLGVARELQSIDACLEIAQEKQITLTKPITADFFVKNESLEHSLTQAAQAKFDIALKINEKTNACQHFYGRKITAINAQAQTPYYIKERLIKSGMRSIDALVDISNYVMLELGQPSHFFDAAKIAGELSVTTAGEFFEQRSHMSRELDLINHQSVQISDSTIIIHDNQRVLALAGVMGGAFSKVQRETRDIYIECASWNPSHIQGKTREYKLNSEAAHRFERGVDPMLAQIALTRLTELVLEICGTEQTAISSVDQQITALAINPARQLTLRHSRLEAVLGISLKTSQVQYIFNALNFENTCDDAQKTYQISIPSHRFDIHLEADLIEEVVRLYGFDHIPLREPQAQLHYLPLKTQKSMHDFRQQLAQLGFQEVVSFGFTDATLNQIFSSEDWPMVRLLNPISESLNAMRQQLLGALIEKLAYNQARHQEAVRLFEIGHIFTERLKTNQVQNGEVAEPIKIAGLANGLIQQQGWHKENRAYGFYDMKADVEHLCAHLGAQAFSYQTPQNEKLLSICHPGRVAEIYLQGELIGFLGELHPSLMQQFDITGATYIFEIDYQAIAQPLAYEFKTVPKYPSVKRDLAWVVDEALAAGELLAAIPKNVDQIIIENPYVFDIYKGQNLQGKKSIAFSFTLSKVDATLTDAEIEEATQKIQQSLAPFGQLR